MSEQKRHFYEFGEYRIEKTERLLTHLGEAVPLPPKAADVLIALLESNGNVITKEQLMQRVWPDTFVEEANLSRNVFLLRKALGDTRTGDKFIETIPRRGYRFVGPVSKTSEGETIQLIAAERTTSRVVVEEEVDTSGNLPNVRAWTSTTREGSKPYWRKRTGLLLFGFLGVSLILGAAFLFFRKSFRSPSAKSAALTPFENFKIKRYSDNGSYKPAVISPDGKFVAYTDKTYAVWLKNTVTDSSVRILPEIEQGERVMIGFSPDVSHLYLYHVPKGKHREILKVAIFGSAAPEKIAEDNWSIPSLSPDGNQIAFTRFDAASDTFSLIEANTDGTGERTVAMTSRSERFISWIQNTAWSPDSSRIACLGRSETETETDAIGFIEVFRVDDGREVMRIKPEASLTSLRAIAWLRDADNLLVIAGDQSSLGQIYRYTLTTGNWRRVTNDLSDYQNLSVAADDKSILTTLFQDEANLWVLPDGDANRARQITFGFNIMRDDTGVSWTASGKIVYATNTSGRWEIWSIDADGRNQKQLTQKCAGNDSCAMPFVSPDDRYVVFQAARGGKNELWRIDLDGGNPKQLTIDGGISPFVTSDGKKVIYVNKKSWSSTLLQIPIEGGESRPISKIPFVFLGDSSPDGKRLAFVHYDKAAPEPFQTCVAALDVDTPEKCFGNSRGLPQWTADGQAFFYLDHEFSCIWKQPLNGDRQRFLEFPGDRIDTFAFAPDGKQLVVARSHPTQSIVTLIDAR